MGWSMIREVVSSLRVWDAAARRAVVLPPGTLLTGCRIRKDGETAGEPEVYCMEFEAAGHVCACPLFLFQPRTAPADRSLETAVNF